MIEYDLFKFKSSEFFHYKIWSKFEISRSYTNRLKIENNFEFSKLNEYSEYLIRKNFKNIDTVLHRIRTTRNGYAIDRKSANNQWIVRICIKKNIVEIKRSI